MAEQSQRLSKVAKEFNVGVDTILEFLASKGVDDLNRNSKISPETCLLYTSPSPRDGLLSRMPSSA